MNIKETEVRFLEIAKNKLIEKLTFLNAQDEGEQFLEEIIFYDKDFKWRDEGKFIRLRTINQKTQLSYKHHIEKTASGTEEIEIIVSDKEKTILFLEKVGFVAARYQEKKRHKFILDKVIIDIDEWPRIPVYVELEGENEQDLKKVAKLLDFDWSQVVYEDARTVIEKQYNIPVGSMKYFTFSKFE